MTKKELDRKNVEAVIKSGEMEKYSADYFKKQGKIGAKIRWASKTPEERKQHSVNMNNAKMAKKKTVDN